jgi:hypothetical protein
MTDIATDAATAATAAGATSTDTQTNSAGQTEFKCVFEQKQVNSFKFAEVYQGRIVSLHEHFMPIGVFRQLFASDRQADFVDIAPAEKTAGFTAQIGDIVTYNDGTLTITRPQYPDTVDGVVNQKTDELKLARDNAEVEDIIYNGNTYDYDDKARERINAAIIALDLSGGSIQWTTATNTVATLTSTDLKGIVAGVALRSNALHEHYRTLKEQIAAIVADTTKTDNTKKTEIKAVTW